MIINAVTVLSLAAFVKATWSFGYQENDSDRRSIRTKRSQSGENIKTTLRKLESDLSKFSTAFKIPHVEKMKVVGIDGTGSCATCRVTVGGKDFALKVCDQASGFGQIEKNTLLDLSPKKPKMTFVPEIIDSFSKESITLDGNAYTTVAMSLAGPVFKKFFEGDEKMSLDAIKLFVGDLAKAVSLLHGAGWCHNDLRHFNIAINGETGKQDQFLLLNYGVATKATTECKTREIGMLADVVMATLDNAAETLPESYQAARKRMNQFLNAKENGKFLAELEKWTSKPKLFGKWAPGEANAFPKFDAFVPFVAS